MGIVETVLEKIQALRPEQQQAVLEFTEFLAHKNQLEQVSQPSTHDPEVLESGIKDAYIPQSALGKKLYEIRQKAISEGTQLLTAEEINAEIAEHRRYHIFNEDIS